MSSTYYVYCGPFLCCEKTKQKVKEEKEGCVNKKCSNYHDETNGEKFCSECGTAVSRWHVEVTRSVTDWWEVWGEGEPILWRADVGGKFDNYDLMTVEGSRRKGQPRDFQTDEFSNDVCVNLTDPAKQANEIAWFKEKFAKAIQQCKDGYGEDKVNVCWGLLTWRN